MRNMKKPNREGLLDTEALSGSESEGKYRETTVTPSLQQQLEPFRCRERML